MVLPLPDFSGKSSLTCRDQAGQSQGMLCATEQDRECQELPNAAPSAQSPLARSTGHTPASPTPLPAQLPHSLCTELWELWLSPLPGSSSSSSRRVSHCPLPKSSSWGWVSATQHKGMRWGWGRGAPRAGAELGGLQEARAVCEAAGPWGLPQRCPRVPVGRTGCPHSHPPAVAAQGRSLCNQD